MVVGRQAGSQLGDGGWQAVSCAAAAVVVVWWCCSGGGVVVVVDGGVVVLVAVVIWKWLIGRQPPSFWIIKIIINYTVNKFNNQHQPK